MSRTDTNASVTHAMRLVVETPDGPVCIGRMGTVDQLRETLRESADIIGDLIDHDEGEVVVVFRRRIMTDAEVSNLGEF